MAIFNDLKGISSGTTRGVLGGAIGTLGTVLKLPELNISERIIPQAYAAPSPSGNSNANQRQVGLNDVIDVYGTGKNYSTGDQSRGGFGALNQKGFQPPQVQNLVTRPSDNQGGGSELDLIEGEFNNYQNYLSNQESQANNRYNEAVGFYDTQLADTTKQLEGNRITETEGIKKNESLNLARVRQLLTDLEQKNAARVAITGGGSTADVLAERFGRTAQEKLGNVQEQAASAIQRVNDFYTQKVSELQSNVQAQKLQARQLLEDNLSQISYQRGQSAQAKQSATVQAWRDYYDRVRQAEISLVNYEPILNNWKTQKENDITADVLSHRQNNAANYDSGLTSSYDLPGGISIGGGEPITSTNPLFRKYRPSDEEDPYKQYQYNA